VSSDTGADKDVSSDTGADNDVSSDTGADKDVSSDTGADNDVSSDIGADNSRSLRSGTGHCAMCPRYKCENSLQHYSTHITVRIITNTYLYGDTWAVHYWINYRVFKVPFSYERQLYPTVKIRLPGILEFFCTLQYNTPYFTVVEMLYIPGGCRFSV